MSFAEFTSPQRLAGLLSDHNQLAYLVLFLGAFLETLIPFSLLIPGEIFFLSGALLAGMDILSVWAVLAVCYAGGILGDNASYWLGRHYGRSLFARLTRWPFIGRVMHRRHYKRGMRFFERRGAAAVFTARLSGPFSWVTPAMAGAFRLSYPTFLRFNTLGVLVGIGEFVLIGYFFGAYLPQILAWLERFSVFVLIGIVIAVAVLWRYRPAGARQDS